jgi:hypothetical protein
MNQNQSIAGNNSSENHGNLNTSLVLEKHTVEVKSRCIEGIWEALDKYHHEGMGTQELKTIVKNVIENRVEIPELSEA